MDFEGFMAWQKEKPDSRSVNIKIEGRDSKLVVFVYDYNLEVGARVSSPEEIDLEGKATQKERDIYYRLRQKFETVT